jgi:MFS family permease
MSIGGSLFFGPSFFIGAIVGLIISGVIAMIIGRERGWSGGVAFLMGALLGIIGIILVLVIDRRPKYNYYQQQSFYPQQPQWTDWSRPQQTQPSEQDWAEIQRLLPQGWVLDSPRFQPPTNQWTLAAYDPAEQPMNGFRQRMVTVTAPTQETLWGNMIVTLRAGR